MKKITEKLAAKAAQMTEKTLKSSANSTSCFIVYQPEAPKNLKKFRKF